MTKKLTFPAPASKQGAIINNLIIIIIMEEEKTQPTAEQLARREFFRERMRSKGKLPKKGKEIERNYNGIQLKK